MMFLLHWIRLAGNGNGYLDKVVKRKNMKSSSSIKP